MNDILPIAQGLALAQGCFDRDELLAAAGSRLGIDAALADCVRGGVLRRVGAGIYALKHRRTVPMPGRLYVSSLPPVTPLQAMAGRV